VNGPIDVIEDGVTGALDQDLGRAARRALALDPRACRENAVRCGWDASAREFESNLAACQPNPSTQRDTWESDRLLDAVQAIPSGTATGAGSAFSQN
jgi:hypothetical protein